MKNLNEEKSIHFKNLCQKPSTNCFKWRVSRMLCLKSKNIEGGQKMSKGLTSAMDDPYDIKLNLR